MLRVSVMSSVMALLHRRSTGSKRTDLYGKAIATFVPTTYIEPFGAVAIESQMAGTPAITTNSGAFPETVEHGRTGFRCRTLDHFLFAAQEAPKLDPQYIHRRAVANYSMNCVRWMYQEYFQMLTDLWGRGWYTRAESDSARLVDKGYHSLLLAFRKQVHSRSHAAEADRHVSLNEIHGYEAH